MWASATFGTGVTTSRAGSIPAGGITNQMSTTNVENEQAVENLFKKRSGRDGDEIYTEVNGRYIHITCSTDPSVIGDVYTEIGDGPWELLDSATDKTPSTTIKFTGCIENK